MTKAKQKMKKSNENQIAITVFFISIVIAAISIVINKQNAVATNSLAKMELDNDWHTSTISKVYQTSYETEIYFTDGTRIAIAEDSNKDKSLIKLKMESGMNLHFKEKFEKENLQDSKIKTYVCTSKKEPNECLPVSKIKKASF